MLGGLFVIDLVVFMDRASLAVLLPRIEEVFALTDATAGMLAAAFTVGYCATLPLVGWLCDRYRRTYVLAAGVGVWSVTSLATGFAQDWTQLLVARCLSGIGEATCAPIGPMLIADAFPRHQRSRALGVLLMAIPLGSAVGYVLGSQASVWLDWRWAFYTTGVVGAIAACLALTLHEPTRGADEPESVGQSSWTELLHNRGFAFTTLGMALMVFSMVAWNVWAPTYLTKLRHMSLDDAGLQLGIVVAATGIGGIALGGWIGDLISGGGSRSLLRFAALMTVAAAPCFAFALMADSLVLCLSALTLGLTLIWLNVGPLDTALLACTAPKIRGAGLALNALVLHLIGEVSAPFIVGAVSTATGDLAWGLALAAAVLLAAAASYACAVGDSDETVVSSP